MRIFLSLAVAALALPGAHAEEKERPREPKRERVGWRVDDRPHTAERAGYPPCVAKHAQPGRTCHDYLGYVGGSCLSFRGGGNRCEDEGTIGWDYALFHRPGLIFLNWCHCREKQPKVGPYKSDGPHVPDVFALRPLKRLHEGKAEE